MNHQNPFVGQWIYRSLINDTHIETDFNHLEFGRGRLEIVDGPLQQLTGTLGGPDWSLTLTGSRSYGDPMAVHFQGKGIVSGEQWLYEYQGYLVPDWPSGIQETPAIVGSIVRIMPHSGGDSGVVHPAGVVASWYAVKA